MMKTRLIEIAALAALVVVGCGKKDGADDAQKVDSKPVVKADVKVERTTEQDRLEKIFDLAEKSAQEDVNVNFYGFFTGMSRYDAAELAAHYKLKNGNVLEWCEDLSKDNFERMFRGGAFDGKCWKVGDSANRWPCHPYAGLKNLGFRLVADQK